MDSQQTRTILVGVITFIIGFAIGLFLFGWVLTPVEYTGAKPQDLLESEQRIYLVALSELYAFDNNQEDVRTALGGWQGADQAICDFAGQAADLAETQRLEAMAVVLNGAGCPPPGGAPAEEAGGGRSGLGYIALICGLLAVLGVIVAAIFLVWQRRSLQPAMEEPGFADAGTMVRAVDRVEPGGQVTPLARFQTTYARGHDTYDDSFSIESAEGDFLGECGVGLSETVGPDVPKNVTAFEIWLFDKNDIRTVTKVVMSDYAFFDEAIKAKLAPKGEPVLARSNETIVLETASLIVNAEITELEYGTGTLPHQSFFERFTVELSAWAKEGDFEEPDIQGRVDDMLDV